MHFFLTQLFSSIAISLSLSSSLSLSLRLAKFAHQQCQLNLHLQFPKAKYGFLFSLFRFFSSILMICAQKVSLRVSICGLLGSWCCDWVEMNDDEHKQVDLLDFIDWSGVECLNQNSSHSLSNALKQVELFAEIGVSMFYNLPVHSNELCFALFTLITA